MITTFAPAKINWVLEVLGKRSDGYHEVRTVLQTIELHDELTAAPSATLSLEVNGGPAGDDDLVLKAARALALSMGEAVNARLSVVKRIPEAAGLGGGSSDAAAALRVLTALRGVSSNAVHLAALASSLGSDVPFFLHGGTALAEGRGELVTPLPDSGTKWIVLVTPPHRISDKTRTLYAALRREDFSDGAKASALAAAVRSGEDIEDDMLFNAFDRVAFKVFDGLATYKDWLLQAGARSVHLSGSGPALFALASGEAEARAIRARMNRARRGERVHVVRTVGAAESMLTWESPGTRDNGE